MAKKLFFDRGFKEIYKRGAKLKPLVADCSSCKWQIEETGECGNSDVTSYDITLTENRKFCTFWQPLKRE
jgi:hypothetical protein